MGHGESKGISKKKSASASLAVLQSLTMDHKNLWKNLRTDGVLPKVFTSFSDSKDLLTK